jgi:hypothetical protein
MRGGWWMGNTSKHPDRLVISVAVRNSRWTPWESVFVGVRHAPLEGSCIRPSPGGALDLASAGVYGVEVSILGSFLATSASPRGLCLGCLVSLVSCLLSLVLLPTSSYY